MTRGAFLAHPQHRSYWLNGGLQVCFPVAAYTALASVGAEGGTATSPTPSGKLALAEAGPE